MKNRDHPRLRAARFPSAGYAVSQAYRELERDGLVHVRRGQGTYASETKVDGAERRALASDVAARALRDRAVTA